VKLRAWDEALNWQETVRSYVDEHSSSPLQKAFDTGYDSHYLRLSLNCSCSTACLLRRRESVSTCGEAAASENLSLLLLVVDIELDTVWQFGIVLMALAVSTKLLYIEPG